MGEIPIYVVGAGPWDPGLLTLRAVEVLREADVVYYGSLVNEEVITKYASGSSRIYMGHVRRVEHEKYVVEALKQAEGGLNVVFLKNGDPSIFGRGIEICRRAIERGIMCEVVPGVPSFAAAASRGLIDLGSSILLVSNPTIKVPTNYQVDSIIFFMASNSVFDIVHGLGEGLGRDYVVHVASRVTYPDERFTIIDKSTSPVAKVDPPSLVIVRRVRK